MADASQNKPMKELTYALVGVVAFLGIVLLIGVSAFLRPAGDHIEPEVVADETVVEESIDQDGENAVTTVDGVEP